MNKRFLAAALPLAAALVFGPIFTQPAAAAAAATPASAATTTVKPATKPVVKPPVKPVVAPTAKPKPVKPMPPRPNGKPIVLPTKPTTMLASRMAVTAFTVPGMITSVNAPKATITVLLKGGRGAGTGVTMTVAASARIKLDGRVSTLAALPVGAHVSVQGTVSGTVRTASKITAESRRTVAPAPAATSAPAPVRGPSDAPAQS